MSAWWLGGSMMGGGAAHGGAVISSILKYLKYIHANKSIWCLDCEYYGRNRELFELFSYSESVTVINSDTAADQLDDYLIIRELRRLAAGEGRGRASTFLRKCHHLQWRSSYSVVCTPATHAAHLSTLYCPLP